MQQEGGDKRDEVNALWLLHSCSGERISTVSGKPAGSANAPKLRKLEDKYILNAHSLFASLLMSSSLGSVHAQNGAFPTEPNEIHA